MLIVMQLWAIRLREFELLEMQIMEWITLILPIKSTILNWKLQQQQMLTAILLAIEVKYTRKWSTPSKTLRDELEKKEKSKWQSNRTMKRMTCTTPSEIQCLGMHLPSLASEAIWANEE